MWKELACVLALGLGLTASPVIAGIRLSYEETSLGKVPTGARVDCSAYSPDGRRIAYPVRTASGWSIVIDGVTSKTYEWVMPRSLVFGGDSKRLFFHIQKGDRVALVADEVEGKEYKEFLTQRAIPSPDGAHVAYVARPLGNVKGVVVVLDGTESKPYDGIDPKGVMFSPDSAHMVYVAELAGKKMLVLDGKEVLSCDNTSGFEFASGGRWACMVERGGKQRIVIDGKESEEYDRCGGINFSPDGKRIAFAANRAGKFFAVIDGAPSKSYDMVSEPIFSPDSTRSAFIAVQSKLFMVVVDGNDGIPFDRIADLEFSSDGKHLAYRAVEERKQRAVLDEKAGKPYDLIRTLKLSSDGSRFAYAAREVEKDFLVLDGREIKGAANIIMSPDAKYVAHSRDTVGPATSILMVNETEGKAYDGFPAARGWKFTAANKLQLLAVKNAEIFRVEVTISEE